MGRTIGPAPPSFEENIGQADSSAAFLTAASGVPLWLTEILSNVVDGRGQAAFS